MVILLREANNARQMAISSLEWNRQNFRETLTLYAFDFIWTRTNVMGSKDLVTNDWSLATTLESQWFETRLVKLRNMGIFIWQYLFRGTVHFIYVFKVCSTVSKWNVLLLYRWTDNYHNYISIWPFYVPSFGLAHFSFRWRHTQSQRWRMEDAREIWQFWFYVWRCFVQVCEIVSFFMTKFCEILQYIKCLYLVEMALVCIIVCHFCLSVKVSVSFATNASMNEHCQIVWRMVWRLAKVRTTHVSEKRRRFCDVTGRGL